MRSSCASSRRCAGAIVNSRCCIAAWGSSRSIWPAARARPGRANWRRSPALCGTESEEKGVRPRVRLPKNRGPTSTLIHAGIEADADSIERLHRAASVLALDLGAQLGLVGDSIALLLGLHVND